MKPHYFGGPLINANSMILLLKEARSHKEDKLAIFLQLPLHILSHRFVIKPKEIKKWIHQVYLKFCTFFSFWNFMRYISKKL